MSEASYALFFLCLTFREKPLLEDPLVRYGVNWEEQETEELLSFVHLAMLEMKRRGVSLKPSEQKVRITSSFRIYIGQQELKLRPMAKTVLLLFLRHPEGILLKNIVDYKEELEALYRKTSRSSEPCEIDRRIQRIMDLFNNELNVSIARVNKAIAAMVAEADNYRIDGEPGGSKRIQLDRQLVIWES